MCRLVLDTSCIIAFVEEIKRPDLLRKLIMKGCRLMITNYVKIELERGNTYRKIVENNIELEVINISESEVLSFINEVARSIGKGEASVMLYSLKAKSEVVIAILDDRRARKIAEKYNVNYHGTLWLINTLMPQMNIIMKEESDNLIKILRESGFYTPS